MHYIRVYNRLDKCEGLMSLEKYKQQEVGWRVTQSLYWCEILADCLGHRAYYLTGWADGKLVGVLPLVCVSSALGKFLISMPYVNWGGIYAVDSTTLCCLAQAALQLSEKLDVDYLELRGGVVPEDSGFHKRIGHKVVMVRYLPTSEERLWQQLDCKVRNQIRKARKMKLHIESGGKELIRGFYNAYAVNMHHLGTPVYPVSFLEAMWQHFGRRMEIILVRRGGRVLAGGVLLHGNGISEVPLAASRPDARDTCANMLLFWQLLVNSIQHDNYVCDFGRCTPDSGSYHFKKRWGAQAKPLVWYYYPRRTEPSSWAKEHPRFQGCTKWWKRLPLPLTTWLGPYLVRGIPV